MTNRFALFTASFTQEEKAIALEFLDPILKSNTNDESYQATLSYLRAVGPENLNMDFNEEDRKKLLQTPSDKVTEDIYHWTYALAFKDGKSIVAKEDNFMYGGQLQVGSPMLTNRKIWKNLRILIDADVKKIPNWYNTYTKIMRGLAYAGAIEDRKRNVMLFGVKIKIGEEKVRIGKTNPHLFDMLNMHPLIAKAIPDGMKPGGTILAEILKMEAQNNRKLAPIIEEHKRKLKQKVGKLGADMILGGGGGYEKQFRELSKLDAATIMKTDFLQFFDTKSIAMAFGRGDFKSISLCIPGMNLNDPQMAANISYCCSTAAIYMPNDFSGLPHRAGLEWSDGLQAGCMTTNLTKLPLINVTQTRDTRGTTGQNAGYHPQNGMNCTLATMQGAQTYLIKSTMANNGEALNVKFDNKKRASTSINYINVGQSAELVHESKWDDFFMTVSDPERKKQKEDRKRKGLPTDDSNKGKRQNKRQKRKIAEATEEDVEM